jgi:hypothetical protein
MVTAVVVLIVAFVNTRVRFASETQTELAKEDPVTSNSETFVSIISLHSTVRPETITEPSVRLQTNMKVK